jgi:hypothetical protein
MNFSTLFSGKDFPNDKYNTCYEPSTTYARMMKYYNSKRSHNIAHCSPTKFLFSIHVCLCISVCVSLSFTISFISQRRKVLIAVSIQHLSYLVHFSNQRIYISSNLFLELRVTRTISPKEMSCGRWTSRL